MKRYCAILLMGAMLWLTGCQGGGRGEEYPDTPRDTAIVAISSEPTTLDPIQGWGHGNVPLIQSTLLKYNSDMEFEQDLALDYAPSEDGLTWSFTLREDAKFTDGEPVKASDVAFTFQQAKEAKTFLDLSFLESIQTEGNQVHFHLSRPTSVFLNLVASLGIVPEHAYTEDYGIAPVGSGPFRLVQWNPLEYLVLEANEEYYGEQPHLKQITIAFMNEDVALAAVRAGQVDVALTAATLATAEIPGYRLEQVTSVDNRGLTLPMVPDEGNVTESGYPIGNDVTAHQEIRQAIAYAIDREWVGQVAVNGFASPCYSENDGLPWNQPEVAIKTDVDYARELLKQGGWQDTDGDGIVEKEGQKAQFTCLYPSGDSVRQAVAAAVAEQIKGIGIQMVVEGTSWDDLGKRMFSNAVLMGWGSANPNETYALYHSTGAWKDDFYNPEGYRSDITDEYLEKAMAAQTVEEAYEFWKLAQWDGETGPSMPGACPWVWIVNLDHLYYVREGLDLGVQKLHPHGASWPLLRNAAEWRWST